LAFLTLDNRDRPRRLVFQPETIAERNRATGLYGSHYDPKEELVRFPLEPITYELLRELVPTVQIRDDAENWYNYWKANNVALKAAANVTPALSLSLLKPAFPRAAELYPYQRAGVCWMVQRERGILADEPGLGKTIQSLVTADALATGPILVVTLNTVKSHWARHIVQWFGDMPAVAQGQRNERSAALDSNARWTIVNHEMLRPGQYAQLADRHWGAVIVDEAHKLQGRTSQVTKGLAELNSEYLWLLTGTPVWNKAESVWNLLHIVDPRRFTSFWAFVDEYCEVMLTPWSKEIVGIHPRMMSQLQEIIGEYVLQRKKAEVLTQLPDKIITTLQYQLTDAQRKAYKRIKKEGVYDNVVAVTPVERFRMLRQICNAPTLAGFKDMPSAKWEVIHDLVDELLDADRKIVIYTWHKDYAKWLAQAFLGRGVRLLTGDVPPRERDGVLDDFRTRADVHILVATIATAGTGIDLVEATAAIFAEGSYIHTLNTQAEDRLHRIGQHDSPLIYRLMATRTVEEVIWQLHDERSYMSEDMLQQAQVAAIARTLNDEDF